MDIERTMEFIVEQQAATAAQITRLGDRLDKVVQRQDKTDRQIKGILTLIRAGMKALVEQGNSTDERINALIDAQERSEKKLDRLIQILQGKGRNGRQR